MKENLDIFPALYYSLYKQNKNTANKEYKIDDFIKIHYFIIKTIQEILLIKRKSIKILNHKIKIRGREVKKAFLNPKKITWENKEPFINDYWEKLIDYIQKKLEKKIGLNFLNLFFIDNLSKNEEMNLKFTIY